MNRLIKEGHRPVFQGARARAVISVRGYENYWDNISAFRQPVLQLRSTHARQPHVQDEAVQFR